MAAVKSENVSSFRGRTKAMKLNGRFVGAIRERRVKLAKMSNVNIRNAQIRKVQPKPTSGKR